MILYFVYWNGGNGGPVDELNPIGATPNLNFRTPPLGCPSDNTFLVRAYDTSTGFQETNADARVRVVIDSAGDDVTGLPSPPVGVAAVAAKNAGAAVSWFWKANASGGKPTGFRVYAGTPTPNFVSPVATSPFIPGAPAYRANLTGLIDGATYQVVVRAFSATGEESNTNAATFTADATGPLAVEGLTGSATN